MITITSQPPAVSVDLDPEGVAAPPVPVSDPWQWCMQGADADAIITPGAKASVEITIATTVTVPANGTTFLVWGREFQVQSAQNFTAETVKLVTSGLQTMKNLLDMFRANIFFLRNAEITFSGSPPYKVFINWKQCRVQPNFTADDMDVADVASFSMVYANGTDPVYTEAYQIGLQFGFYEALLSEFAEISLVEGFEVDKLCSTIGPLCCSFQEDAQSQLFTELPALTSTSFTLAADLATSLYKYFSLRYGWTYRVDGLSKSGTFMLSDAVLGINAAFSLDDPYQMRRYWHDHPDGYPPDQSVSDYLTTQPKVNKICPDGFAWLWLLDNWQHDYGLDYTLKALFSVQPDGGHAIRFGSVDLDNAFFKAVNFNVSPQAVADLVGITVAEIVYYEVQVTGFNGATALFNASEYMRYEPAHACGCTDLYVLTPPGGIATVMTTIESKEVVQEGTEIFLSMDPNASREDQARYGGRTKVGIRNYERIAISVRLANNADNYRWLKEVRSAPQHWLRITDQGGLPLAKKFFLDFDTAKILPVQGQALELSATGYFADTPVQAGIEP